MSSEDFLTLKMLFDRLVGLPCWGVSAGGCTGSQFGLEFGDKIKRREPVENPMLPEVQRKYKGEIHLFVKGAAWRLDNQMDVVTSSTDDNSPDGPMVQGLERMVGHVVTSARLVEPGLDATIVFENGLRLQVFCDQFDLNNYTISHREFYAGVGSRSRIALEGGLPRIW